MNAAGILTENDNCELIEGLLVTKMEKNPSHSYVTQLLRAMLQQMADDRWFVISQEPITTMESEPEPDVIAVRGMRQDLRQSHARPDQVVLVVEVAESTLAYDRTVKKRLYARAGIAPYWIIDLVHRQIEVYAHPLGPSSAPTYGESVVYKEGDEIPVIIDGREAGRVKVKDLMP